MLYQYNIIVFETLKLLIAFNQLNNQLKKTLKFDLKKKMNEIEMISPNDQSNTSNPCIGFEILSPQTHVLLVHTNNKI